MRLVLDEIPARDLAVGDRLLWEGRGLTISEIGPVTLDPEGRYGAPYVRLEAVILDGPGARTTRLLLEPGAPVFRLAALGYPVSADLPEPLR